MSLVEGFSPWELIASNETKKVVKENNKEVIHPIFQEYMKYTDDPHWEIFMDSCSRGSFPKFFSLWRGQLTYRRGNKSDTINLFSDPKYGCQEIIKFMKFHGKRSKRDNEKDRNETPVEYTWKNFCRKKSLLFIFIEDYCNMLGKKYCCNSNEIEIMISALTIWLELGYIKNDNVVFDGNDITNISGIYWNKEKRVLELDDETRKKVEAKIAKELSKKTTLAKGTKKKGNSARNVKSLRSVKKSGKRTSSVSKFKYVSNGEYENERGGGAGTVEYSQSYTIDPYSGTHILVKVSEGIYITLPPWEAKKEELENWRRERSTMGMVNGLTSNELNISTEIQIKEPNTNKKSKPYVVSSIDDM